MRKREEGRSRATPRSGDSSERLAVIDSRRRPPGEGGIGYYLPIGTVFLCLVPLLIMPICAVFWAAFQSGVGPFIDALRTPEASFALRLSLIVALVTSAVNMVIGTLTAYVLSKYRFPGKNAFSILVNLPVAIPTVVVGTSLLILWGPQSPLGRFMEEHLGFQPMFKPAGILLAHIFVTFPYMLGGVKPVLDEIEITYEEAAYTMGAGRLKTFAYVILPALKGGLIAGVLLTFAHSLGEFGATVMVSGSLRLKTQTAPLYIYAKFEADQRLEANAVAAVLALLSFVIFFAVVRAAERDRTARR